MRRTPWQRLRAAALRLRFPSFVLLTLVPGLLLPALFIDSVRDFYKLNVSLTDPARRLVIDGHAVETYMKYKLQSLPRVLTHNQQSESVAFERRWANDEIHLDIAGEDWDRLRDQLPAELDTYQPTHVWNAGQYQKAEFRFRGDSGFHWLFPKKSFKLKADKNELIRGHRELNFTVKYPYRGVLVGRIAKDFGLLAPDGDPVKVFLNNQFYGVHRFLEEVDEGFLRNNRRMPGNVYKGEGLRATGDWHAGLLGYFLLYSPYVWPKIAVDNSLTDNDRDDLENFSRLLALPEMSALLAFREQFDLATVSRNIAFNIFVNEWHSGDGNNLRWYVDPTDGKFYPIVWDGYAGSNQLALRNEPGSRTLLNHAYHRLGSDPRVMHDAFVFLYGFLTPDDVVEKHCAPLRRHLESNLDAIGVEELHTSFGISADEFSGACNALEGNRNRLLELVSETQLETRSEPGLFEIGTAAPAGILLRSLEVSTLDILEIGELELDTNLDRRHSSGDQRVSIEVTPLDAHRYRVALAEPMLILPAYTGKNRLRTSSLPYGVLLPPNVRVVSVDATNAVTGARVGQGTPLASHVNEQETLHPWEFPQSPVPIVMHFDHPIHNVLEDLVIPAHATLVIRPGTRIVMGENVTIRSFGRILAEGTAAEPITFTHAAPHTVWGVLALQGEGASGSRFRHVSFEHGSLARFGPTRYPGMVSVHRANDVSFHHCEFAHNLKGDDLLRAAHATVDIVNSVFHDANSDAIDLDYSTGNVTRNRFTSVGNDCIDLMTSSPDIVENTIEGCGDKGVSVGESSSPLLFNNLIAHAGIGVQLKDGSNPLILHNTIARNKVGIHAYRKNWRYDRGGSARVYNTEIVMNKVNVRVDPRSRLVIDSSRLDKVDETAAPESRVTLHNTVARAAGDDELAAPAPNREIYSLFAPLDFTPKVGRVQKGSRLLRPNVVRRSRFHDGFRLDSPDWNLHGSEKLYVEGDRLKAQLDRFATVLENRIDVDKVPENARVVLSLAASKASTIDVELTGQDKQIFQIEVDERPRMFALPVRSGALESVRFRSAKPLTLEVTELDVLADPSTAALASNRELARASR